MVIIEKLLTDYYEGCTIPVFAEYPTEDRPDYFVLIEKVGSSEKDQIVMATITVQSYAPTLYQASVLNEQIKAYMDEIAGAVPKICNCRLNSDHNFTDVETKEYRYQAVYDIKYYRKDG